MFIPNNTHQMNLKFGRFQKPPLYPTCASNGMNNYAGQERKRQRGHCAIQVPIWTQRSLDSMDVSFFGGVGSRWALPVVSRGHDST